MRRFFASHRYGQEKSESSASDTDIVPAADVCRVGEEVPGISSRSQFLCAMTVVAAGGALLVSFLRLLCQWGL